MAIRKPVQALVLGSWLKSYALKHGISGEVLRDYTDDVAYLMRQLIESGKSPKEAYDSVLHAADIGWKSIAKRLPHQVISNKRRSKRTSKRRHSR
jgi:hypothetical protein